MDLHQTLRDLATCELDPLPDQPANSNEVRRYSLWRERVPVGRDCPSARIPDAYCMCGKTLKLDTSLPVVQQMAEILVQSLNSRLSDFKKCAHYTLKQVTEARITHQPGLHGAQSRTRMDVVFQVNPSNANFRGSANLMVGNESTGKWLPKYEIDRLDKYGGEGDCVKSWLSKYCDCWHK